MANNSRFLGYNNNLLRNHHQNMNTNNIPFQNNQLLRNNPNYISSINNNNFQQKLYMAKMEQLNRAKKVNNMNVSDNDLYNYVINPIKVEKATAAEINREYNDRNQNYIIEYDKNKKYMGNKVVREWWKKRTNQPYKNILKKENYIKKIRKKSDLIIHKVTDDDKIGLMNELEELENILEKHNNQLSIIYSKNEKLKHKKKFQYNNVYKYRLKHNVKDFNELKDFYKKEQKKIEREDKRIDNMISHLMDADILNDEQKQLLQKQLQNLDQKTIKDDVKTNKTKASIRKASKTDKINLTNDVQVDNKQENNTQSNKVLKIKKVTKNTENKNGVLKIKTKTKINSNSINSINNSDNSTKLKIKTIKINLQDSKKSVGKIDNETFEKYKNRC